MTLDDVKNELWSFTDWKTIMFLMAEIEKLKISLAMAEDAARKGDPVRNNAQATLDMAVSRCSEIAGQTSKLAEHRIKVEFGL